MSYIKKIEEEYNSGIISLDKLSEQREFYNKLSQDEKDELNKKLGSKSNEKNISKSITKDEKLKLRNNNNTWVHYIVIIPLCLINSIADGPAFLYLLFGLVPYIIKKISL